ncbi:EAL domain, c-di-GMP-specific phosphodiesterase class I (or its enzymatically inactive variant) [Pseudobutyrivibrio sp. UC1225]|uniref:EAL domain-containing protein n=1 Tax=Pseudobutyrivibrio sp. UC1225 TaxID=1798185 RepID=UPI0008E3DF01|nr:EAL domain-containing protein [Pseudobutyrivibrio sp. UC1225]SFN64129.1 EAL domain, c-di-GMP-specific phosphodiesterase class I (or its enzymatically inactive variant) [Pseudobutyrivibrio sp. UC1225]
MGGLKFRKVIQKAILSTVTVLCFAVLFVSSEAASSKDTLIVGVPTDRCPMFYIDNVSEETVGIGVDLIREVAKEAGYDIIIKNITEGNMKDALDSAEYDVIMPFGSAITSTSGMNAIVTENLMEIPFTLVTTKNSSLPTLNTVRVGMPASLKGVAETVHELYPGMKIVFYDDIRGGVKGLQKGEVDALLNNSYVWSYVLQKPSYVNLHVQPSAMFSMGFKAGTLDTPRGQEIIDRLNMGISRLEETKTEAIILDYTTRRLYHYDLWDYMYQYGAFIILGILLFAAVIGTMVFRQRSITLMQEERLRLLIDHDELTGAYSMNGFRKRVEEILRENPSVPYFISYNNIVDFKFINDSFGKETGDKLLKYWVKISKNILSEDEAIGRVTADQFVVLRRIEGNEKIYEDEQDVVEPVNNFLISQGKNFKVQLCSGIYVLTPDDLQNIDVDHMIDFARIAERKLRESGKTGFEFYNLNQWETKKRTVDIVGHLSSAIEAEEIQVWYQPQVNFESNTIIGAEALCRWAHGNLGWISPGEFIPALENSGKIYELDCYVWEKVCKDLHRWNNLGKRMTVSVNVSRSDISENPDIHLLFMDLIRKYELTPDQLHIEITESAYVKDSKLLILTTENLRSNGFLVEMDDFGSGYSSLNMLKELPVDRVKLDLRFLSSEGFEEKGQIILTYLIQMIQLLGMDLLAEGVETLDQAMFLKSKDCLEMQGYYFHKPMSVIDFEELI